MTDILVIDNSCPVRAGDAGLFVSSGQQVETMFAHEREHELIFVRQGTLRLFEGQTLFTIPEHHTHIVQANTKHGILLSESDEVSFYWVLFGVQPLHGSSEVEVLEVPRNAIITQPERLLELVHRFVDDQRTDRLSRMMGSHLVALMLCEICRQVHSAAIYGNGKMASLVDSVGVYIAKHYHDQISTCTIAAKLNYNPDYLERVFRSATGMSITEAIHKKRIKEARRQLIHEYRNVSEIAYACGFSDSGYFRRVFKRHTDMTPTMFRSLYSQVHMRVG